jgi:hypothetical protein
MASPSTSSVPATVARGALGIAVFAAVHGTDAAWPDGSGRSSAVRDVRVTS